MATSNHDLHALMCLFTPLQKDRMAADCGAELADFNVTFLSLWPGSVKTELVAQNLHTFATDEKVNEKYILVFF